MSTWTTVEAVKLCTLLEPLCAQHSCHVALTGGTLYKPGSRKDLDILIYRVRQAKTIPLQALFAAWKQVGLKVVSGWGWCYKADYEGKPVDVFVPEEHAVDDAKLADKKQGSSGQPFE